MTRLLVVSPDTKWNEYLSQELGAGGIEILGARTSEAALSAVDDTAADPISAVLVNSGPSPGRSQDEAALEATEIISGLRQVIEGKTKSNVPILLWSKYPAERLARIAKNFASTSLLSNDTFDAIQAALATAAGGSDKKPAFARVEMEIDGVNLRILVTVDGKGAIKEVIRPTVGRPNLKNLEDKFSTWALWQRSGNGPPRYTDYWHTTFSEAGQSLADELDYGELAESIAECLRYVDVLDKVYFRFSLLASDAATPHPFIHVPFELLYDSAKNDFVRSLAPVARRICLKPATMTATPLAGAQTFLGPALFIKSDAHGSGTIPGTRFGGSPKLILPPLKSLDPEFEQARSGRQAVKPELPLALLPLTAGADALEALQQGLRRPPGEPAFQIIHFAGHSVQADDGSVYLILPGSEPGQLRPLAIGDFAAWVRAAGAQLVLLSSCQSSAPDAVFRLAQAGIPAVIGFRWEVADEEASQFTGGLHKMLAQRTPLARAFHAALCAVRTAYPKTPTFASPMLVVQNEEWTI